MDRFRRQSYLILVAVLLESFLLISTSCRMQSSDAVKQLPQKAVVIRNLESPGSLVIENEGPTVSLYSQMLLQSMQDGKWQDEAWLELVIREACDWQQKPGCLELQHGAKLHPVSWNGLSCGGQCAMPCRGNSFMGPGQFRFVVSTCDRSHKFYGPVFSMPDYDHSELKKSGR